MKYVIGLLVAMVLVGCSGQNICYDVNNDGVCDDQQGFDSREFH